MLSEDFLDRCTESTLLALIPASYRHLYPGEDELRRLHYRFIIDDDYIYDMRTSSVRFMLDCYSWAGTASIER